MLTGSLKMSNRSQASKKKSKKELSVTDAHVNSAVKVILLLDHNKKAIKQADVLRAMPQSLPRAFSVPLFDKVKEKMLDMGLTLHFPRGQNKLMFVSSCERDKSYMLEVASQEEKANRTLLVFILGFIFMKGGTAHEDEVLRFLKKIHIYNETRDVHPYFGDVKKKIQSQYVDEMYLSRKQVQETGQVELEWGDRADAELSKKDALEFVCKIGYNGERKPEDFAAQFSVTEEDDEQETASDEEGEVHGSVASGSPVARVRNSAPDEDDDSFIDDGDLTDIVEDDDETEIDSNESD